MAVKEIEVPEVGLVKIYKRRDTRAMRLSLPYTNYVRLTMPAWLPYRVGVAFVRQKKDWIIANKIQVKAMPKKPLKAAAEAYLKPRLKLLAKKHGYSYNKVSFKYLRSRWGSCSTKKDITLNIMLMDLPTNLIDHVLIHELVHTKVLRHGPDFWKEFEERVPQAKRQRKILNTYNPHL